MRAPVAEPRTAYTPAGAGLPEYWGQPEARPERSPHARVLPQTPETMKEPGLWAGDRPMAASSTTDEILGVQIPLPEEAETETEKAPTRWCVATVKEAIATSNKMALLRQLDPVLLRCLVAMLHEHCADVVAERYDSALDKGKLVNVIAHEAYGVAAFSAGQFREVACKGVTLSAAAADANIAIRKIWNKAQGHDPFPDPY